RLFPTRRSSDLLTLACSSEQAPRLPLPPGTGATPLPSGRVVPLLPCSSGANWPDRGPFQAWPPSPAPNARPEKGLPLLPTAGSCAPENEAKGPFPRGSRGPCRFPVVPEEPRAAASVQPPARQAEVAPTPAATRLWLPEVEGGDCSVVRLAASGQPPPPAWSPTSCSR